MNIFLSTELFIIILFLFIIFKIYQKDRTSLLFITFATFYAIFFENINIFLSQNMVGGYFYNPHFLFFVIDTPLFVILSWAMLMYGAKKISEVLPLTKTALPFIASLLVLLIDLSIDAVAIRLNFWTWRGYNLTEGFWGVPANNFIGWLLIAFTFFWVYQKLENFKKESWRLLATSFGALFLFFIFFGLINQIKFWLNLDKNTEFILLILILLIFFIPLFKKSNLLQNTPTTQLVKEIFIIRWTFHFFSLIAILYFKIYQSAPFLLAWTFLLMGLETLLEILAKKSLTCGKLCDKIYSGFEE